MPLTATENSIIALDKLIAAVETVKADLKRQRQGHTHEDYADRAEAAEDGQELLRSAFARAYDEVGLVAVGHDHIGGSLSLDIDTRLLEFTQDHYEPAWDEQEAKAEAARQEKHAA